MKKALPYVLLLVTGLAWAQATNLQAVSRTYPATGGSVPSAATDGIDITNAKGWHVTAVAANPFGLQSDGGGPPADAGCPVLYAGGCSFTTAVLDGGGALLCYYYANIQVGDGGAITREWQRCDEPLHRLDVSAPTGAMHSFTSPDFTALVGDGRLAYLPSSMGVTLPDAGVPDGGQVTVTISVRKNP